MLKHISLPEQIANGIRQDIMEGRYPAGTQLRQDALAERYNASRIPVREALLLLEAEGLVHIIPRKGAVVTPLSAVEIEDVFALRQLLELRLFSASAPRLTPAQIATIKAAHSAYQSAVQNHDRDHYSTSNSDFHLALYDAADMPKTRQIVAGLLQTSERYTCLQLSTDDALQKSVAEHAAMISAIEAGDYEQAGALLKAHLSGVLQDLHAVLAAQ